MARLTNLVKLDESDLALYVEQRRKVRGTEEVNREWIPKSVCAISRFPHPTTGVAMVNLDVEEWWAEKKSKLHYED